MPTKTIRQRLDAGELLLMDGGTGSELQGWSATANVEFADVVQQVH